MLVKLGTDEIVKQWPALRAAFERALPPVAYATKDEMEQIHLNLLADDMQAWMAIDAQTQTRAFAVVLTAFAENRWSGVRELVLYSVTGLCAIPPQVYAEGYAALSRYARANGCQRIVGYTTEPYLVEMAKALGGEAAYTFISLPTMSGTEENV